jgi:hypothetical protein
MEISTPGCTENKKESYLSSIALQQISVVVLILHAHECSRPLTGLDTKAQNNVGEKGVIGGDMV